MRNAIVIVFSALMFGGCILPDAKSPHTGAVVTGEQLAVVDDVKTWTTTSKEKVGETEYTDANGNKIGTGTTYADKTTVHSMKVWYPFQGNEQLSDEDFFRITNDQQALAQTAALRETAKTWNKRGKITMGAGLVGAVVGFFIPQPIVKSVLMIGGGLAVSGGYYAAYWGAKQMEPEVHAVERSAAERDALQYNGGRTVGLSVGKRF
jgi:hypothetical protein